MFSHKNGAHRRSLRISFSRPAVLDGNIARWEVIIESKGTWTLCQQFTCGIDDDEIEPRWLCGQPIDRAKPAERMAAWRRSVPVLDTDYEGLRAVVARSAEDLGALRIFDPDYPERTVVAAGAPWFMTLFGRDSLLTAWMALLVDPELALGTLQTLARFQGQRCPALQRGGARPHPARDALRRGVLAVARRRHHLLRHRRRHPAVRDAARGAAPVGPGPRGGRRAAAPRRPGHRVDRALRRPRRRRLRGVPAHLGPGPAQPGLEGHQRRRPLRRRPPGRPSYSPGRGAGLYLRGLPGPGLLRRRAGGQRPAPPSCEPGRPP